MNRPLLLLLGTGLMLGLNFPIGKLAVAAGIAPALWAAFISFAAGSVMLILSSLQRKAGEQRAPIAKFAMLSGFLSYVVPNFLTFAVIPQIGSGLASVMFAMSPVTTALLSLLLKVRPPGPVTLAGIALGLLGALVIIAGRGGDFTGHLGWTLLALLIPVFLAAGNVYRTMGWPAGAGPIRLAAATNLAAVPPLLAISLATTGSIDLSLLASVPGLALLQVAASSTMFLMFFRLQQLGGPTYLSQIGYVSAVVGMGVGVVLLDETYPFAVWAGAGIVAAGIALTTFAQWRASRTRIS